MRLLAPDILGGNDGAAGSKGGEDVDEQDVDGIYQRNAGYGSFSADRNHNGICHADGDRQKLLDDQRDNQLLKVFFGEHESSVLSFEMDFDNNK